MTALRRVLPHALVPVLYGLAAVVLLGSDVVTRCGDTIFGGAGDSTAGLIWLEWNYDVLDALPWRGTTPLLNAPQGAPLWQPFYVTALVLMLPMWVVSQVVGPVCSWNVGVIAGLLLDGWIMYLFVRWLTKNAPLALVAGLAFLLLPHHYQKAHAHLAYVHSWVFVLILWSTLRLLQRATLGRGALLGLSIATACYLDGYYLLIATTFGAASGLLVLLAAARDRSELIARLRAGLAAAVVLGVALVPIFFTLATSRSTISGAIERSPNDVATYSARPWEYVLPARHHPLLPPELGAWQDRHLHESNYSEQTLYLGAIPLTGAVAAIVSLLFRRHRARPVAAGPSTSAVVGIVAVAALFCLVMSAPPRIAIGGIVVPMPSGVISGALPFWRVYARFVAPIAVCVITLASVVAAMALSRGRPEMRLRLSIVAAAVLAGLVVLDFLPPRPPLNFSYERDTPAEYEWLDDRPANQIIAEYPLDIPPLPNHITYLSYQRTHQQRLVNGAPAGTRGAHLAAGLAGLADPQTVPALAGLGVRYVVLHPTTFGHPVDDAAIPADLRLVHDSPTGRVYEVDRTVAAAAALAPGAGFHATDTSPALTSSRWMRDRATLEIRRLGRRPTSSFSVSFEAVSFGEPRRLEIRQRRRVVWAGEVSADQATPIAFEVDGTSDLQLRATPRAVPIEQLIPETNDDRRVAISIARLAVTDR